MGFNWTPKVTTPFEQDAALMTQEMSLWEFAKLQAAHTFERSTTTGLAMEELRIKNAEGNIFAGYEDPITASVMPGLVRPAEPAKPNIISEEEFKAKGFDKGGRIDWTPDTTLERAEIEADILERRDYESQILNASNSGVIRSAVGFGAALIGSLPDPVNLIPVVGPVAKGATLGARVARGAAEGFIGSAIGTAIVSPIAADKGEDISFSDIALDLTFGSLIGAGVGTASGLFHNRRVKSMSGDKDQLRKALVDSGMDEASALSKADQTINVLADVAERSELSMNLRKNLSGLDRINAGRLMDKTISALINGESIDIGSWAKELGAQQLINKASAITSKHLSTQASPQRILSQQNQTVQPGKTDYPSVTVISKNGVTTKPTDFLSFSKKKYNKNKQHSIDVEIKDGYGITSVRIEDSRMRNDVIASVPKIMRDFEPVINSQDGKMWVSNIDRNKQLIIYDEVVDGKQMITAQLNLDNPLPVSRSLVGGKSVESPVQDASSIKVSSVDGQQINTTMDQQNFSVPSKPPTVDFMSEKIDLPNVDKAVESSIDFEFNSLVNEGKITNDELIELRTIDEEIASINKLEEATLTSLECIVGATV